jgi:DNA-binding NarL/FixJ family response regulator
MTSTAPANGDRPHILVVEDHPLTLEGILKILSQFYGEAEVTQAHTFVQATALIQRHPPDLVILDLQIPHQDGDATDIDQGIALIKRLMSDYPTLNIAVHSSYPEALIRIRPNIDNHQGGFTVTDKSCSTQEAFERFECALRGYTHTRDIASIQVGVEMKPEWLKTLDLACRQGYTDRAIAKQLHVGEGQVRNYWRKVQDVFSIYPENTREDGKNIRMTTCNLAREKGLIK